jgi:two-component system LytT family response regulator
LQREPHVSVVGEYGSPAQALAAIQEDAPDVVFLDIQMPGVDGFALLDQMGKDLVGAVVFVTAYDQHAVRAFDVRAIDYLLKPVAQERLHETLERVRAHLDRLRKGEIADQVRVLLETPEVAQADSTRRATGSGRATRIPIQRDGNITFVNIADIDWIQASGDCVRIHSAGRSHVVGKSMGEMLALLDPSQFVRIHRSAIVNVERIRELQPYFHGEYFVILKDGTKLKLSRGRRGSLVDLLGRA